MISCNNWNGLSLLDSVKRINEFYELWSQMRKNAKEDTKGSVALVLQNFLLRVYLLLHNDLEKEAEFKKVRDEIRDIDILFSKLNKKFLNQKVLYNLSQLGYTK